MSFEVDLETADSYRIVQFDKSLLSTDDFFNITTHKHFHKSFDITLISKLPCEPYTSAIMFHVFKAKKNGEPKLSVFSD